MTLKTKILSLCLLMAACAAGASAQDNKLYFGYSGENIAGVGIKAPNIHMAAAVKVSAQTLQQFAGNSLSGLNIGFGSGIQKTVTLFLSHDLGAEPFYTQEAKIKQVRHWNEIDLATPYAIEDGVDQPLYVGYYLKSATERDFQLGIDESLVYNENSCLMAFSEYENEMWGHFRERGADYGNATISLVITGDKLPRDNGAVQNLSLPAYATPGAPFNFTATVRNNGCNPVGSVTLTYAVGTDAAQTADFTFTEPLAPGATGDVEVTGVVTSQDSPNMPVEAWVSVCNGQAVASPQTCKAEFPCSNAVFERKVVVEEATGTWCGNCPVGYVGMEYMKEHAEQYPAFIGIAMHNRSAGQDPMHCDTYEPIVESYISAFPNALVNRDPKFGAIQPDLNRLPVAYAIAHGVANQGVEVFCETSEDRSTLHVTAQVRSAVDTDAAGLSLSFALTEDNVGPYEQTNYFSSKSSTGLAEWFETQPYSVPIMFNDVARYLEGAFGISKSLPAQMRVGETYTYATDLPLATCDNLDNVSVTAMLLDTGSGEIRNADRKLIALGGVEGVGADAQVAVTPVKGGVKVEGEARSAVAYDLRGRVAGFVSGTGVISLPQGAYIVKADTRTGVKTVKALVR